MVRKSINKTLMNDFVLSQSLVYYFLFSTTESISPKDLAVSAVIKLSLSKAVLISSTDLPVCLEYISFNLF